MISENDATVVPIVFQYDFGQIFGLKIDDEISNSKKIE
jgi:hypothetical protein